MPSTDTTLCAFIRNRVLPDAGYPQDADCKVKYDALCACVPDTIVRGDGGGGEPVTLETQLIAFLEMAALSSASERDKSGGAIGGGLVLSTIHQVRLCVCLVDSSLSLSHAHSAGQGVGVARRVCGAVSGVGVAVAPVDGKGRRRHRDGRGGGAPPHVCRHVARKAIRTCILACRVCIHCCLRSCICVIPCRPKTASAAALWRRSSPVARRRFAAQCVAPIRCAFCA